MADGHQRDVERSVMRHYRSLLDMPETAFTDPAWRLEERLAEVQQLYESVSSSTSVAELDGAALERLAAIQWHSTERYRVGLTFRPLDFADRLEASLSDARLTGPESAAAWARLGKACAPFFMPVPGPKFVLGTLRPPDAPQPERRQRAPRAPRAQLAPAVAPDRVVRAAEQTDSTRRQVRHICDVLKGLQQRGRCPVSFFEFVYHPTDFGLTVENLFHTSILVRERLARVKLDGDGLPVITPVVGGDPDYGAGAAPPSHQVLLQVDHESWRRVVAEFDIQRPLIPPSLSAT